MKTVIQYLHYHIQATSGEHLTYNFNHSRTKYCLQRTWYSVVRICGPVMTKSTATSVFLEPCGTLVSRMLTSCRWFTWRTTYTRGHNRSICNFGENNLVHFTQNMIYSFFVDTLPVLGCVIR